MSAFVEDSSLSRNFRQTFAVHSIRLVLLGLVLGLTLLFQIVETRIVAQGVFLPIYGLIGVSFVFQCLFFLLFKKTQAPDWASGVMFFVEAIYITLLIYFVGIQQSLLIFLFLVNIILCGVLLQTKGALALATVTSILFSFLLSLDQGVQGQTAVLAVGINNLAFFSVAYLSGYLSEQLNFMGVQLKARVRDIKALKNLNALILSNMNSGLMTMEADGTVIQMNPFAQRQLQRDPEETDTLHFSTLFPDLPFEELLSRGEHSFDYVLKGGEERKDLRMHLARLQDDQSEAFGYILTFQDETEVRRLQGRVRQSEKLAAIGQLAAGIAHEIRNPLASISGSVQLLQASGSGDSENGKLMNIVNREINRLNGLITEFLDYARPEAPLEDQVDLGKLMAEIVELTNFQHQGEGVEKEVLLEEGCVILGNRDKLKQAFLNILVNAYQALEKRPDGRVKISVARLGSRGFQVLIADNGCGIEEKVIERIFEPFLTTKHKGTGLGLAITHSIFETHGAQVGVDSEIGRGTQFRIDFLEHVEETKVETVSLFSS